MIWRLHVQISKILIHVDKPDIRVIVGIKHNNRMYQFKGQWPVVDFECQPKIDEDIYMKEQPEEVQLIVVLRHPQYEKMKKFGQCQLKLSENAVDFTKCLDKNSKIFYSLQKQQLDMDISLENPITTQNQFDEIYYLKQADDLRKKIAVFEQEIKKQVARRQIKDKQIEQLQKQLKEYQQKQSNIDRKLQELQAKLQEKTKMADYHKTQLQKSKQKLAAILDVLYERGEAELLEQLETLINQ